MKLDFVSHSLDVMCFLKYDNDRLIAIAPRYVDVMFAVCSKKLSNFTDLEKTFVCGKLAYLPQELISCGREINQCADGRVVIAQKEYIEGLQVRRIPASRVREGGSIAAAERAEMRSCIGRGQ